MELISLDTELDQRQSFGHRNRSETILWTLNSNRDNTLDTELRDNPMDTELEPNSDKIHWNHAKTMNTIPLIIIPS